MGNTSFCLKVCDDEFNSVHLSVLLTCICHFSWNLIDFLQKFLFGLWIYEHWECNMVKIVVICVAMGSLFQCKFRLTLNCHKKFAVNTSSNDSKFNQFKLVQLWSCDKSAISNDSDLHNFKFVMETTISNNWNLWNHGTLQKDQWKLEIWHTVSSSKNWDPHRSTLLNR